MCIIAPVFLRYSRRLYIALRAIYNEYSLEIWVILFPSFKHMNITVQKYRFFIIIFFSNLLSESTIIDDQASCAAEILINSSIPTEMHCTIKRNLPNMSTILLSMFYIRIKSFVRFFYICLTFAEWKINEKLMKNEYKVFHEIIFRIDG